MFINFKSYLLNLNVKLIKSKDFIEMVKGYAD